MAFFPFFIRQAWCSFSESWESSQIPSYRVASLLKGATLFPTLTWAEGGDCFLRNRAASVFSSSKAMPLLAAHVRDASAAFSRLWATFSSVFPPRPPGDVIHER